MDASQPSHSQTGQPTLVSLDRLPQEIISLIFDIYILSTPLSSPHYQDILCLDHQTHNRAVVRLYDKVTLHADNACGFYVGLEDIASPLEQCYGSGRPRDEKNGWSEELEALLGGYVDYSLSRTARYPKHYLLRRVSQITFLHPSAFVCTGGAVKRFRDLAHVWENGKRPNQSLFLPVSNSGRNFGVVFPRSLTESLAWEDITGELKSHVSRALDEGLPRNLDVCLTLPATVSASACVVYLLRSMPLWNPARLSFHGQRRWWTPMLSWVDGGRLDVFEVIEMVGESGDPGKVSEEDKEMERSEVMYLFKLLLYAADCQWP
ncbi:hypothetical protein IAT38_005462 [Cryptococcus sp. DSM 104549]